MIRMLKRLAMLMGLACVVIGAMHLALGIRSVHGEGSANATVDSRERFYGAVFLGYGLAWLWAARQTPIPSTVVRWLTAVFFLGGVGRVVSLIERGRPQWLQLVLTAIELGLPVVVAVFVRIADRTASRPTVPRSATTRR